MTGSKDYTYFFMQVIGSKIIVLYEIFVQKTSLLQVKVYSSDIIICPQLIGSKLEHIFIQSKAKEEDAQHVLSESIKNLKQFYTSAKQKLVNNFKCVGCEKRPIKSDCYVCNECPDFRVCNDCYVQKDGCKSLKLGEHNHQTHTLDFIA